MPDRKHHVFSARTTEEGLKILNQLKDDLKLSWDELVVNAVCAHYGLDKGVIALPKAEKVPKVEKIKTEKPKAEKAKTEKTETSKLWINGKGKTGKGKKAGKGKPTPDAVFESAAKEKGLIDETTVEDEAETGE